jgi:hypothetical protein
MRSMIVLVALAVVTVAASAAAQQGKWAAADDPTAKYIIDKERQWAESACTHSSVAEFLAEDFQGTAPDGKRYDKAQALENDSSVSERDCRLDDAKVRVFGEHIALAFGSERAVRKPKVGKEFRRCLVWTDTWLERENKWQIVSAQDTQVPCQ